MRTGCSASTSMAVTLALCEVVWTPSVAGTKEGLELPRFGGHHTPSTARSPLMGGIGGSIATIALGAILTFAVTVQDPSGININTIGVILMIAGAIGLVVTASIWGGARRRSSR